MVRFRASAPYKSRKRLSLNSIRSIGAILLILNKMASVGKYLIAKTLSKASLKMEGLMERDSINGLLELFMKDNSTMGYATVWEPS